MGSVIIEWFREFWVILVAIMGGVTLIWNFLNKTVKEIKNEFAKPFNAVNARFDEVEKKIEKKHENYRLIVDALLTMQKKSLLDSCEKYINRGYATLHQKEVVMMQYESYNELGGNSFIHELVERVNDLPLEEPKKTKLNE